MDTAPPWGFKINLSHKAPWMPKDMLLTGRWLRLQHRQWLPFPLTTPVPRQVPAAAAAGRGLGRLPPGPLLAPPRWTECHEVPHTLVSGCHRWTRSGWLIRYFLSQTQILAS